MAIAIPKHIVMPVQQQPYDEIYARMMPISDVYMAQHPHPQQLIAKTKAQLLADAWTWFATHQAVPLYRVEVETHKNPAMCVSEYRIYVPVKYLPNPPHS